MDRSLSKFWEMVKDREVWGAAVHGVTKNWTRLSDLTTTTIYTWPDMAWSTLNLSIIFSFLVYHDPPKSLLEPFSPAAWLFNHYDTSMKNHYRWVFIQFLNYNTLFFPLSVQSLSRVRLFATPWTAACQASLSTTNSQSLPKLMSIESVMPSNHLILCRPLLLLPSIFPNTRVFSNESALRIR